jgi:hypothetical protein
MSSDESPEERQQSWTNLIGCLIVLALAGSFLFFYGNDLLNFLAMLSGPRQWPGK